MLYQKHGEGGSKKFNNGTIWDEMGQNKKDFKILNSIVTLFVTPKNHLYKKEFLHSNEKVYSLSNQLI